jgi:hypothetical protein
MTQTSNSNPYISQNDIPTLRRSVVAFVDILGYSELSRNESTSIDLLIRLRDALQNSFRPLDPGAGVQSGFQRFWMTKTFTDNIVIGFPINSEGSSSELIMILGRLGQFQLQMTLAGFFVRGAVSVDKLYVDDHIVFGPALIEAHDGEQKLARDPRILLCDSAREMSKKHDLSDLTKKLRHQHDILFKDADGQFVLNYLYGVVEFEHDMGYPATDYLQKHREIIKDRLKSYTSKPKIWAKYYWCAVYHNYFCLGRDDFAEFKINMDLFIPQPQRNLNS